MAQYFERWLNHIKPNVSARTHERYSQLLLKNLLPVIGGKLLSKLQPVDISEAYAALVKDLSPRTVHHIHRALSSSLSEAERWKLLPRQPLRAPERRDCGPALAGNRPGSRSARRRRIHRTVR